MHICFQKRVPIIFSAKVGSDKSQSSQYILRVSWSVTDQEPNVRHMLSFQVGPLIIKIHLDKASSEELVWFTYQIAKLLSNIFVSFTDSDHYNFPIYDNAIHKTKWKKEKKNLSCFHA